MTKHVGFIRCSMRHLSMALLLCFIALQVRAGTSTTLIEPIAEFTGTVFQVKDGDSLVVRSAGKLLEVRLHGIDAPEWKQPHGEKAKKKLRSLVLFKKVTVTAITIDSYDRVVSVIYNGNKNINLEMVKTGHAWWYKRFAKSDKALKKAQAHAEANRLGLWNAKNPMPPWEWRQKN